MADLTFIDRIILDGESVYLDDEETLRLYNDGGTLKQQKLVDSVWVDYASWGA